MKKRAKGEKTPVSILTGFLGAGKTTLLNNILTTQHGLKIAVIENEFGEVGVDDALVKKKIFGEEDVFEMNNGCICCTVRGDLIRILLNLFKSDRSFDAILIETTGLADPAPVAQTFFVNDEIQKYCELDAIITVVDAKHVRMHLEEEKPVGVENESIEQISFADRIILNKTDLVTPEELKAVEKAIRKINGHVKIIPTTQSKVDVKEIMGLSAFNLTKVMEMDPKFLEDEDHQHDKSVTSIGMKFVGDMNMFALQEFISVLLRQMGPNLFRYKGVLSIRGMDERYVFQGVHMLFSGEFMEPWGKNEVRENRFVFIGKNLDREKVVTGFEACKASDKLRFAINAAVKCNVESGWEPGSVIQHWDEGNCYRVLLKSGDEVWAPNDTDEFIRVNNDATVDQFTVVTNKTKKKKNGKA